MSLVNPHLQYDSIPFSKVDFPSLPFTAENQAIFNWWHEPQSPAIRPDYVCEQFYDGELLRDGFFILTEASTAGYSGAMTDRLGMFFGEFQQILLSELNLGTVAVPSVLQPVVADTLGDVCCFPSVLNPDFYGQNAASAGYNGLVNDYVSGSYTTTGPKVPHLFVAWVLKKLAILTNTTIEGNFFTHPQWSKLVLYHIRELNGAASFETKNYLPDWTIETLLLELRKIPNLKFTFKPLDRVLSIDFWEDDLAATTGLDWSKKATRGESRTPELNPRLQLGYELDSNDALMKDKPAALSDYITPLLPNQPSGIAKLSCKFSTLLTDPVSGLATAKQIGISSSYAQGASKLMPRLLFWNGIVATKPRALPTMGGLSLYWNGVDGLAKKCWANTEAQRGRQFYLKKNFVMNEMDLASLDFGKKVHVNGVDYLVASVDAELPLTKEVQTLLVGGV